MEKIKVGEMHVPSFIYGTAWKEDRTARLVQTAVRAGFRAIDTANQRRHYSEAAVGEALSALTQEGTIARKDLFLQTKFTYIHGQDHRLPYDPQADFSTQVSQSFAGSLEHLGTDYVDSYVLHGPLTVYGLTYADWEVWEAMTAIYRAGKTKLLGVSNVNGDQLAELIEHSGVRPHFVQNRCFARMGWDRDVRELCREHAIVYQGFSLLTANARELQKSAISEIAARHGRSLPQIVFRFALQVGMVPLTGTTNETHMKEDLAVYDFDLDDGEVNTVDDIAWH